MEFNGWNSFEDFARACGYNTCNKDSDNTNSMNNSCNMGCSDIPNGFQSLNPELFVIIGEILGNIAAGNLPFNVQNAIGNWLELVGQAILTFNAQQQYFQGGPGRYFNPKNYNVTNSFCTTTPSNTVQNNSSSNDSKKNKERKSNSDSNIKTVNENYADKIESLELRINQLTEEIENLKNKL